MMVRGALSKQVGNDAITADPGADAGTQAGHEEDQEDAQQPVLPPAAQGADVG